MDTASFIQRLADTTRPVRRLRPPSVRTAAWFALAVPYVALIVAVMGPREDLGSKLSVWRYMIEQAAALATSVTAAVAAFRSTIPAFDRRILALPLACLAVWLGVLGAGCIESWVRFGPAGLSLRPDWFCVPAILLVGLGPALTMALMLRRGAPLSPHLTTALGGLAAAGLGNFGLRLFHPQDASVMVLVWQMSTVFMLTALAGFAGRLLLNWRALTSSTRRTIASPAAAPKRRS